MCDCLDNLLGSSTPSASDGGPNGSDGGACIDGGSPPCCQVTLSPNPLFVCAGCTGGGQTDIVKATGSPGGGTFAWSSDDSSIAAVAGTGDVVTVSGVAPAVTRITVSYNVNGHTCSASVPVTAVRVVLELKNTGKIVPTPENSTYAADKSAADGIDDLGALPMGKGRGDAPFKNNSNISPLMVIGTVSPVAAVGLTYRWKRLINSRKWFIRKDPGADKWKVTQASRQGFPSDDTGSGVFNNPVPNANRKIYIYDNSGSFVPSDALNKIGDYIFHEKDFIYRVERDRRGSSIICAEFHIGQKIVTKRKAATGRVSDDWDGLENSTAVRTFTAQVTEAKVRAIVGGSWPIEIDAHAND